MASCMARKLVRQLQRFWPAERQPFTRPRGNAPIQALGVAQGDERSPGPGAMFWRAGQELIKWNHSCGSACPLEKRPD